MFYQLLVVTVSRRGPASNYVVLDVCCCIIILQKYFVWKYGMIDWQATKLQFNRVDLSGNRPKVVVVCDLCGATNTKTIRNKRKLINNQIYWNCNKCVANKPEKKLASKTGATKAWKSKAYRAKIENNSRNIWKDKNRRNKMAKVRDDPKTKLRMIEANKNTWSNPELRQSQSIKATKLWSTKEYRDKVQHITCSSIQHKLYSILDDLKVEYYREYADGKIDTQCIIGPYTFDCMIRRENRPNLLIECQGEYWHKLPNKQRVDASKAAYINNNFKGEYEIKYLWEYEFYSLNKVKQQLEQWLGISKIVINEFDFNDVNVGHCLAADCNNLLSKYHYLPNTGRGGIRFGAYLYSKLIAVCVFSPLARQNINTPNGFSADKCRELSRLCIHPEYQKKNFASWFISRCMKNLDKKYKAIISYADTTFEHDGTVYKAANFRLDNKVAPDYWYVSNDGWVMHKRTLYGRAVKLQMKEAEYAIMNDFKKVWGKEKLRFVYIR